MKKFDREQLLTHVKASTFSTPPHTIVEVKVYDGEYVTDGICDGCGYEPERCRMKFTDCRRRAEVAELLR